jgi:hypothetical protein
MWAVDQSSATNSFQATADEHQILVSIPHNLRSLRARLSLLLLPLSMLTISSRKRSRRDLQPFQLTRKWHSRDNVKRGRYKEGISPLQAKQCVGQLLDAKQNRKERTTQMPRCEYIELWGKRRVLLQQRKVVMIEGACTNFCSPFGSQLSRNLQHLIPKWLQFFIL